MPYHRNRAIVLRKTDYSNTSIVLNVLTQEMGRLGLIAKGIKRGGPAFEGRLASPRRCRRGFGGIPAA